MKITPKPQSFHRRAPVFLCAMVCTLAGMPIHAATFPNNPLITGGDGIPPNILLILDDSGSMDYVSMPTDRSSLDDRISHRSYPNNTLFYNPAKTYRPWRTASTDLDQRLGNASYRSAATSTTSPNTGDGFKNLIDDTDGVYYVPKIGVANPGTTSSNYTRYFLTTIGGADVVATYRDVRTTLYDGVVQTINRYNGSGNRPEVYIQIQVPEDTDKLEVYLSGGTGNARLRVYNPSGNQSCDSQSSNGNDVSCILTGNVASGNRNVRIENYSTSSSLANATLTVYATGLGKVAETPAYLNDQGVSTQRSQADELQNFANWYQYFRSRSKTAKAGASEAFGRLGSRYRVGFDTIWNRGGSNRNVSGSNPAFPIPVGTDDGLFQGTNRSTFYTRLQGAGADSGTPLHGALDRAGRYFMTDAPWKDTSGRMLSCRQNYALLTTDGFWNNRTSDAGYKSNVGNADSGSTYSDNYSNTLADVAYYYWKNDLKTGAGWTNNVRPSTADPATWQHMVTFGVSIGLQGRLNPNNPPPATWADPTDTEDADRIDDLWHATLNGRGKFVVAGDADAFADALKAALDTISQRTASGSNIASSSTKTDAGTLTFSAKFTSGSWIGDMSASPFNAALTGVSTTPNWTLSNTFASGQVNADFATRFVLATYNDLPVRFDSSYAGVADFERTAGLDAVSGADNIRYILGDQSKETGRTNGTLRARAYPIGDIVDSSPSYSTDTSTVYVGANDGMMHAIDATNGKVLFSYIPKGMKAADLKTLSSTEYAHRYFMDGQIDVVTRSRQGYGKNILIGAPGRGAKGVFALDVTSPSTMSTAGFLWDRTGDTVDADMGYVFGNVRLRQSNKLDASGNRKIFAFVPNGIDSNGGKAVLFVYELSSTGMIDQTYKLTTDSSTGNGMMSTGLADLDNNGTMDTVYGGDLLGRVWKWDISVLDATHPMPTAGTKLFQATDGTNAQPITGGIGVARDANGQVFVGFGTGRLISLSDLPGNASYVEQTQSIYGIKDSSALVTRAELQARTIPFTGTMNGAPVRGFEAYSDLPASKKGWYINLGIPAATSAGERVITSPSIVGSAMWLTSVIPAQGSDCSGALGSGYLNVMNIFTGTSPQQNSFFDTDATIPGANNSTGLVGSMGIVGGMPTEVNVTSQLATVGDGGGGSPLSYKRRLPLGGVPQRMTWREVVPADN